MRKFILQTISAVAVALTANLTMAQNSTETFSFKEFADLFKNTISLPNNSEELLNVDYSKCPVIDCELYNFIVIKNQKERAKRRTIKGEDFRITKYGYADCEGMTVSDELFFEKTYALGQIKNKKYKIFIARIESVRNTFIDLYVFDTDGRIISFLDLYEDERYIKGDTRFVDSVFIKSKITNNGIIHYEENRYSVNVKIDYQLQDDGVLKEIKELITGQYEVVDKDGYVNVRERPDGKSKVLYTIESGSIIKSRAENGSKWEEVIDIEGSDKKGGYIHSSRLANYW